MQPMRPLMLGHAAGKYGKNQNHCTWITSDRSTDRCEFRKSLGTEDTEGKPECAEENSKGSEPTGPAPVSRWVHIFRISKGDGWVESAQQSEFGEAGESGFSPSKL